MVFQINEHATIVGYTGTSPLSSIKSAITSAYANGNWNGFGITSSLANSSTHGVGYAESSAVFTSFPATFAGESIDSSAVLLTLALYGDANLDRRVNALDFNTIAANFGNATDHVWTQADFNYDGRTNTLDFSALSANFGSTMAAAVLATAVPETEEAVPLVAATIGLWRRRKREKAALIFHCGR